MKRLGVFVFFDNAGIVDKYIFDLLYGLREICDHVCVIINGKIQQRFLDTLEEFCDLIYQRQNIGFDAGAYKDVFLNYIPKSIWSSYDEIILMNDTSYGPVVSLKNIIERIPDEIADFWGITRHSSKTLENGKKIENHIQAYFLVVRKKIIESPLFNEFWENLQYPENYQEAVDNFEIKFSSFFEKNGFYGRTLMDDCEFFAGYTDNPYLYHEYELIRFVRSPFFKRKCLQFTNAGYINAVNALEYIEKNLNYNTRLIWENIFRLCKEERYFSAFNYYKLENFYKMHKRLYIYGDGKMGKKIQRYFRYRNWSYECILVSENKDEDKRCKTFQSVQFGLSDGMILALGSAALQEVFPKVTEKLRNEQLFIPEY